MSINVKFYSLNKRENSTKQPSGTAPQEYDCLLKENCSIINPVLEVSSPVNSYNYCYISTFGRYYYITDYIYNNGVWQINCSVDVLASYKSSIGGYTGYIERADVTTSTANSYNVIDNYYPVINKTDIAKVTISTGFNNLLGNGSFVIGIMNPDDNAVGSISYYVFSKAAFTLLKQNLFNTSVYTGIDDVVKFQFNPLQYIVSVKWFPIDPRNMPISAQINTTIQFGWYQLSISGLSYYKLQYSSYAGVAGGVGLSTLNHPQNVSPYNRGNFLNSAPYSRYELVFFPFGTIELDSQQMADIIKNSSTTSLGIHISIDSITGFAFIKLDRYNISTNTYDEKYFFEMKAPLGVDIQLSQAAVNYVGAVSNVGRAIGEAMTLNLGGVVSSIGNALQSVVPQISSIGTNGSLIDFSDDAFIRRTAYYITDDNTTDVGRAICTRHQISTIESNFTGFVKMLDNDISIACTPDELSAVKDYLTGGFFYE